MEPLVASTLPAVLRPQATAMQSDLAQILKDGRLVAGEGLPGPSDGNVLLALGRHRVPAQTDVRFEPGRSFLFRVEEADGGVILRVIDGAQAEEPALLRALRAVVPHERPIGQILEELALSLRATAEAWERSSIEAESQRAARIRTLLASLASVTLGAGADGELLRKLFLRSGLRYESNLHEAVQKGLDGEREARVRGDLKALLLRAFADVDDASVRELLARSLAGIEVEQLLNVARERAGEPLVWSLPLIHAGGHSTLRMYVKRRDGGDSEEGEERGGIRAVIGLSLPNLGPLRIDVFQTRASLSVRFSATRKDVLQKLGAEAEKIAELLGGQGLRVHVSTREATEEEVAVGDRPLDTRFLDTHSLMDVSG